MIHASTLTVLQGNKQGQVQEGKKHDSHLYFFIFLYHLPVAREYRPIWREGAVASHGSKQKQSKNK